MSNATTPTPEKQAIYDRIVTGIRAQGFLSRGPDGSQCLYLNQYGCRCAAGQLMDPEVIQAVERERGEGSLMGDVYSLAHKGLLHRLTSGVLSNNISDGRVALVHALQRAHDDAHDVLDFESRARYWAASFGVTP